MKDLSNKNPSQIRRSHNSELLRKMRNGESLTSFDSKASWFPPRPMIEKDKDAIMRLYDVDAPGHSDASNAGSRVEREKKPAREGFKVLTFDKKPTP